MMKLNYNSKRTITTADLYDATDPPLTFEVRARPPQEWAVLYRDFEMNGADDPAVARALIAMVFLTVSDGENTYPLGSEAQAQALQEAIEVNNPACGDEFICNIAWAFGRNHYSYLSDRLGNSSRPLRPSNDSSSGKNPAGES